MNILIVCSYTQKKIGQFIEEQVDSLRCPDLNINYFLIENKGFFGYFKNYIKYIKHLKKNHYDLIHAHYGLSGMFAVLQKKAPVVITFHGSDVNDPGLNFVSSKIAERLCRHSIFVNKELANKLNPKNSFSIISCGINLEKNYLIDKIEAKKKMNLDLEKKFVLFSSSFSLAVKNYPLAKESLSLVQGAHLLELKNYCREDVTYLMNACDCLLVTSFKESGPLVVKEALACGCPIVSVDVGDVKGLINGISNCFLVGYNREEIAEKINIIIQNDRRSDGRDRILKNGLEIYTVAKKIKHIYKNIALKKS